ncbi:hypothetical protein [Thiomonas sp.]
MLKAVFVSRSRQDAEARVRRILDAYAPRVGDHAWITAISQEGLETVRLALKAKSKRSHTAVACYAQIKGQLRLQFIVGNRNKFGRQGQSPTRSSARGHPALRHRASFPQAPLLLDYAEQAGYLHDWGKGTSGFQAKLRANQKSSDPVRHEILSLFARQDGPARIGTGFPAGNLLEWLVATHHRLPKSWLHPFENHTSAPNPAFDQTVAPETLHELRSAFQELPPLPDVRMDTALGRALFFYGRLSLQIADHTVSSDPGLLPAPRTGALLANPRQELLPHLRAIGQRSRLVARRLLHLPERLPGVWPESRTEIETQARGRFSWQNQLATAARSCNARQGLIVFLTAETGAGKTRAALRLLSALHGDQPMRATVLLGLRSLTLQTGDAYREMGLREDEMAVLIGSKAVQDLHDDGREEMAIEVAAWDDANWFGTLPAPLNELPRKKSEAAFLGTPVLVCTADYLARATNYERGSHVLAMTRLASADLLLDEIDGYDLASFHALLRLAFLAGMFGRRVICSSATLSPEFARALLAAYRRGWSSFAALSGADSKVSILLSHNRSGSQVLPASEFQTAYSRLHTRAEAQAEKEPAIRRGRVFDQWEDLPRLVRVAHAQFHQDLADGAEFSVGLVRFSRLRSLQQQATRLSEAISRGEFGDLALNLVFLSAQIPLGTRMFLEHHLRQILFRPSLSKIKESLLYQRMAARTPGAVRRCLLVLSTPVIEVGNDLDFDFGVVDPSSTRSIIQTAGRVNRHRRTPIPPDTHNILIAAAPVHGQYAQPGYEQRKPYFQGREHIRQMDPDGHLTERLSAVDLFRSTPDHRTLAAQERRNIAREMGRELRRLNDYQWAESVERPLRDEQGFSHELWLDGNLGWQGDESHIRGNYWDDTDSAHLLRYGLLDKQDVPEILEFIRARAGLADSAPDPDVRQKYMRLTMRKRETDSGIPACPLLGIKKIGR